ncbi:diguanylate cyclase/phosphodiesterase [Albimonas donghaensis]|uniref:Diguanylate cyclase/phosphodiesterase n=1 Tax=Albimonas donghaensis TaxID=356660 RepID=A0A1H2VL91_9RHOB|nr:EAL domain-containing protein [Albimonas donghaensis]SDW69010.1 diguanylate cyclase/phosphodiesterase [Albimonas donghaensis]
MRRLRRLIEGAQSAEGVLAMLALGCWVWFHEIDAFEWAYRYSQAHEGMELDELVNGLFVAGIFSIGLLVLRGFRLRRASRRGDLAEREAAWLARHDPLTGLPNRRSLDEHLAAHAEGRRRGARPGGGARRGAGRPWTRGAAVLCLDLDGFKQVNTLLGHDGGDRLLEVVADRLRHVAGDSLAVRVGGDEFVVAADRGLEPDPMALARRIVAALAEPVEMPGGLTARVGTCVGVALTPEDAASQEEALRLADSALYEAKRLGRDKVVRFDPRMAEALDLRLRREQALRRALDRDEITPHYQPLADLASGELEGFEALARWTGEDGPVPPDEFLPLAEEMGLLPELSDRLLTRACADARHWPKPLRLAFNISPAQLGDRMLAQRMLWILDAADFPPGRLQVEVPEAAALRDAGTEGGLIDQLQAAGARVALDDFGAGYTSLGQLARLKFNAIKIDRGFLEAAQGDIDRAEAIRAIVALGRGLGVTTTAKGIETAEQRARLKALGCDLGQGHLFSPALPPEAAAALARGQAPPPASPADAANVEGADVEGGRVDEARVEGPPAEKARVEKAPVDAAPIDKTASGARRNG